MNIRLRIAKQNAVFLYQLLEGFDNVTNYTTLTVDKSLGYRDIELISTKSQEQEMRVLLEQLSRSIDYKLV